jgi:VWFA-related protein
MRKQIFLACIIQFFLLVQILGQQQTKPEDDVVRITTNLVQVDVVVTDKEGKQVTNLRPEEFEVIENGRKQPITNFSFISINEPGPGPQGVSASEQTADKNAPIVSSALLRPEQVRRTIVFVVDDLGLSFQSIGYVRDALKRFVDDQMQANDAVAIFRTSGNIGVRQQVTSDKRQLYAAIDRVRWFPAGRKGLDPYEDVKSGLDTPENREIGEQARAEFNEFRQDVFAVGTVATLANVMHGLALLPGRKSVVMISEGFKIYSYQGRSERILEAIRRLAEESNRASAVVYTLDASGLQPLAFAASDKPMNSGYAGDPSKLPDVGNGTAPQRRPDTSSSQRVTTSTSDRSELDSLAGFRQLEALANQRTEQAFESQSVLAYLAQQTGGLYLRNQNNLGTGIQQLLENQKGYYLIGYRPEAPPVDPATGQRRFHKLSIKVKGSGLRVRTRSSFYGFATGEPVKNSGEDQLIASLVSPFASAAVHVRLTTLFGSDQATGPFMRSLIYVDARDLSFTTESDGTRKATVDMAIALLGDGGALVGQPLTSSQTVKVSGEKYERTLEDGLVYILDRPMKQPGAYQLRIAVRDAATQQTGAASQFVEVPDLSRNRLTLSSIVLSGASSTSASGVPSAATAAPGTLEGQDFQATPALRRLRQGMILSYQYAIFNSRVDKATGRPQLQTQMRLFREGKQVFVGKVLPYEVGQQTDMKQLSALGRIRVGPDLVPGQYVLQVVATDNLVKDEKLRTAAQTIDFEIVK